MAVSAQTLLSPVEPLTLAYDRERLEDVGFMTCMTLVLLGNYAQTGHFGGPLAYTPYNVAVHLAGPDFGGLRYDYRRPKHPYCDKFMLAGGHTIPTCYALWMIMGEALARKYKATGDKRYYVDPHVAMLGIDALGFPPGRRRSGDNPAGKWFGRSSAVRRSQGPRHPRAGRTRRKHGRHQRRERRTLRHRNRHRRGQSCVLGHGRARLMAGPKIIAFEGEFAMTEGHAQELKTQALALQVGKRLRVMFSDNNAGIDDSLQGGVIASKYDAYNLVEQWTSYGWNVFTLPDGNDYDQVVAALKTMEDWDPKDRRPMVVVGKTIKGYWPSVIARKNLRPAIRWSATPAIPTRMKMNSEYFVALAKTFEQQYGVEFVGIRQGAVTDPRERLIQFKANIDIAMSVLERNGLGDWLADRLVAIGDTVKDDAELHNISHFDVKHDPFLDDRLRVANLPVEPQKVTVKNRISGAEKAGVDRALPQARRNCRHAPRHFGNHQVDELRHRQPLHHAGRRSVGIHQRGTRQPVGPL